MFNKNTDLSEPKSDEDVFNGATLSLEHCFGASNRIIPRNASFINEDTIVYSCGRHLATIDLISNKMDFIRRDEEEASNITCLEVGLSNKKELVIGIGEKMGNGHPRASVYIPNRMRWFNLLHDDEVIPDVNAQSQICQFYVVNEKKYCITISRATPGSNFIVSYWRYDKEKLFKSCELNRDAIKKIAVTPTNYQHFLACGKSYLKFWDATDKPFRELKDIAIPVKYERENDFLDCVFLNKETKQFVTVSAQNNLFIVEGGTVKYLINISFATKNSLRQIQTLAH
jgi:hypothetical protein